MDREERDFGSQLNVLLQKAKKNKNVLELQEIQEAFGHTPLAPAQLDRITAMLEERNIDVLTVPVGDGDEDAADPQANYFIGADVDPNLDDEVRITVIATGFGPQPGEKSFDVRDVINSKVNDLSESSKEEAAQQRVNKGEDDSGLVLGSGHGDTQSAPAAKDKKRPIQLDDDEPDLPVFLRTSPRRLKTDD